MPGSELTELYEIDRNDWKYHIDNEFSTTCMQKITDKLGAASPRVSFAICRTCTLMASQILFQSRLERSSGSLLDASCPLCSLLRRASASSRLDIGFAYTLQIDKIGSRLGLSRNGQTLRSLCLGQTYSKVDSVRSRRPRLTRFCTGV